MAGQFYESQTPLMQSGDFYYPLTTAKQIILPDGRRLGDSEELNLTAEDVGALSVDMTNGIQGEAAQTNSDLLGGIAADQYATVDMIPDGTLVLDPDDTPTSGSEVGINASTFDGYSFNQMLDVLYPVGAVYMSYTGTAPQWDWMTWERIQDAYLLTTKVDAEGILVMNQVPGLIWHRTA